MNAETLLDLLKNHSLSEFEEIIKGQSIEVSELYRFFVLLPPEYSKSEIERRIESLMIIRVLV